MNDADCGARPRNVNPGGGGWVVRFVCLGVSFSDSWLVAVPAEWATSLADVEAEARRLLGDRPLGYGVNPSDYVLHSIVRVPAP